MTLVPAAAAVVFDLDGVIVDSRRAVRAAARAALEELGLGPRDDAVLDRLIGPPARAAFAALLGEDDASPVVGACVDAYHRAYEAVYLTQTSLVDGIADVLGRLAPPLAIATSKGEEFAAPLLSALGIAGLFRVVCAAAMGEVDEPKTAIVGRALAQLGVGAEAVMVGDRSFDVEAALANGIRCVGVTWGIGDRAELEAAGADVIVTRPGELVGVLGGS